MLDLVRGLGGKHSPQGTCLGPSLPAVEMLRPWEAAVLSSSRSPGHLLRLGACLWEQRDIPSKEAQMIHFSKIGRLSADPRAQVS